MQESIRPIRAFALILTGAIVLLGGTAHAGDVWVDVNQGNDLNPGTEQLPFATITHAVEAAGDLATIQVLPGTYDSAHGETFPIILQANQRLIGDPSTKGAGALEPTVILGMGDYVELSGAGRLATVVCGLQSEVAGFQIDADSFVAGHAAVVIDGKFAEVHDNHMLGNAYMSVFLDDAGASAVIDNLFDSIGYGVTLRDSPEVPVIAGNTFAAPRIAINMSGLDSNPWIHGNVFQTGSTLGIQVQGGVPLIEGNTFEAGSGWPHGAIRARILGAMPIVRSNIFRNALAVFVDNEGQPDLGTFGDLGRNDFEGVVGVCIQHDGSLAVSAIGNRWPNNPPIMGEDIIVNGDGSVLLGGLPTEASSFGRLKATF